MGFRDEKKRGATPRTVRPRRGQAHAIIQAIDSALASDDGQTPTFASKNVTRVAPSEVRAEAWFDDASVLPGDGWAWSDTARSLWSYEHTWASICSLPFTITLYGPSRARVRAAFDATAWRLLRWLRIVAANPPLGAARPAESVRRLRLWWILSDEPKRLGRASAVTRRMVNSGYTWPSRGPDDDGTIVLYRTEDALKVFVHETMHTFRYDEAVLFGRMDGAGAPRAASVRRRDRDHGTKVYEGQYPVDYHEVAAEVFARIYAAAEAGDALERLKRSVWQADHFVRETTGGSLSRTGPYPYAEETPAFSYYVATGLVIFHMITPEVDAVVQDRDAPTTGGEYIDSVVGTYYERRGTSARRGGPVRAAALEVLGALVDEYVAPVALRPHPMRVN